MLDVTQKYKRNPDVILKSISGRRVALNVEDGSEYKINEISYDMLEALSIPLTAAELCDVLLEQYNVSRERLIADIETWFTEALKKEIIIL